MKSSSKYISQIQDHFQQSNEKRDQQIQEEDDQMVETFKLDLDIPAEGIIADVNKRDDK